MANTLVAYSNTDDRPHVFRIADESGDDVTGSPFAAVSKGANTNRYTMTVPAALAPGAYSFALHRDNANQNLRSQGEFRWDGTDIVLPLTEADAVQAARDALVAEQTINQTIYNASIAAQTSTLTTRINTRTDGIVANIAALNDPSVAEIEAALLDDGDGTALRAAIAQAVESAVANESDGEVTGALIQGLMAAALTAYDTAKASDVAAVETKVDALPEPLTDTETQTAVVGALAAYDVPQTADIASDGAATRAAITALENLSASDIAGELATYGGATAQDVADLQTALEAGQGLTAGQAATLTFVRDWLEGDEEATVDDAGVGTVVRRIKSTTTVLGSKDVTTTPPCPQTTTIIEA